MRDFFRKHLSGTLVIIQYGCMGLLMVTGPLIAGKPGLLAVELFGIALGFWAIFTVPLRQLKIKPDIKPGALLVSHGPYALIRHPMYAAILLVLVPLIINSYSIFRLLVLMLLLINLLWKISYEESLLESNFKQSYKIYRTKTWKLIPLIF